MSALLFLVVKISTGSDKLATELSAPALRGTYPRPGMLQDTKAEMIKT
ncbi:MAG TPA: hypothetical protein VLE03_06590 [Nitrospiraceae bacterium]|nr:hypothetical protein [Nitrospiraceae bacterium]